MKNMRAMKRGIGWVQFCIVASVYLVCIGPCCAAGESDNTLFLQANGLYRQGKFNEAKTIYEELVSSRGASSAAVYYNLGNCYFKTDDLGRAILNYKRAAVRAPRDKALQANLALTRSLVKLTVDDTRNWYIRTAEIYSSRVTDNEVTVTVLLLFAALLIWIIIMSCIQPTKRMKKARVVISLVLVVLVGVCGIKYYLKFRGHEAVIMDQEVEVRYGPSTNDTTAFRLSAGFEVLAQEHNGDWVRIELRNGKEGWVPGKSIEQL